MSVIFSMFIWAVGFVIGIFIGWVALYYVVSATSFFVFLLGMKTFALWLRTQADSIADSFIAAVNFILRKNS